jgi:hypothetical protein
MQSHAICFEIDRMLKTHKCVAQIYTGQGSECNESTRAGKVWPQPGQLFLTGLLRRWFY